MSNNDRNIERAVGYGVLMHVSKLGGSIYGNLTERRIANIAQRGLTAEELSTLLHKVAEEAYEEGRIESMRITGTVAGKIQEAAKKTDSHTLHKLIEELDL